MTSLLAGFLEIPTCQRCVLRENSTFFSLGGTFVKIPSKKMTGSKQHTLQRSKKIMLSFSLSSSVNGP